MCALGLLAFVMRRNDIPLAPVLTAVILGPLAEYSLREAMANSGNEVSTLWSSTITKSLYGLLALGVAWTIYRKVRPTRIVEEKRDEELTNA